MYLTGIINSVYHWLRRFFPFCYPTIIFPFELAYICVVIFFLVYNGFSKKLFNAVKTLGYGPRRVWFGRVEIEMISVCDRLDFRA